MCSIENGLLRSNPEVLLPGSNGPLEFPLLYWAWTISGRKMEKRKLRLAAFSGGKRGLRLGTSGRDVQVELPPEAHL